MTRCLAGQGVLIVGMSLARDLSAAIDGAARRTCVPSQIGMQWLGPSDGEHAGLLRRDFPVPRDHSSGMRAAGTRGGRGGIGDNSRAAGAHRDRDMDLEQMTVEAGMAAGGAAAETVTGHGGAKTMADAPADTGGPSGSQAAHGLPAAIPTCELQRQPAPSREIRAIPAKIIQECFYGHRSLGPGHSHEIEMAIVEDDDEPVELPELFPASKITASQELAKQRVEDDIDQGSAASDASATSAARGLGAGAGAGAGAVGTVTGAAAVASAARHETLRTSGSMTAWSQKHKHKHM